MNRRWFSHDFPRCSMGPADESAGFSHGLPSCWNHLASREVVPQWYCRLAELEPKPGVDGKTVGKTMGKMVTKQNSWVIFFGFCWFMRITVAVMGWNTNYCRLRWTISIEWGELSQLYITVEGNNYNCEEGFDCMCVFLFQWFFLDSV